ncbi:MAG: glucan biosynthesis protein G [Pseudomonadota bacterium]
MHVRLPSFFSIRSARPWPASVLVALLAWTAVAAHAFDLDTVADLAKRRAQAPFKPFSTSAPQDLALLTYDQYRDIRFRRDRALWQGSPVEATFFHVGRQGETVRIHDVSAGGVVRPVPYAPRDYDYGKNQLDAQRWGDIGHAGFRLIGQLNSKTVQDELIAFLGASYFRALGQGQRYGLSARGLAVDTVGAAKEEFPRFTDFWLQKTEPGAPQTTLWALMDSPSLTGAYRFDLRPGEQTVVEVRARVFMRQGSAAKTIGIAPLTSMFLFGENQPQRGDFRPEVHDSDGLMIATSEGEWLWRPLQNPARATANSFSMSGLKGFGLMQRDRAFANYEDTEARYELRPSAWVTPLGDWGPGRVEMLLLPTPDETHDNIVAYWVPATLPAPGASLDFAYQIAWQGNTQQRPPNGWATQSRRGIGYSKLTESDLSQQTQYVVDFTGPALDGLAEDAPVQAVVTADANGRVLESLAYKNTATGTWRMTLRVQRLDPAKPVEVRAFLKNDLHTLSETWTTLITP